MLKYALLAATATVLAVPALADDKKPAKNPTEITCAVMPKDKVNIKEATEKKMFADYKGRRYFFCCAGCPGAFKKDPEKYAKAPSIPTPKPGKKS
jgi:YHS domain-containing protein